MNKHYLTLALLISTCTSGLLHAGNTQDCQKPMDVLTGKACSCTDTGLSGRCASNRSQKPRTFYCDCNVNLKKSQTDPEEDNNLNIEDIQPLQPNASNPSINSGIYIFSQDINAPIYNLPMQRALVPLSHNTIDCPWFFSFAPYGKTNQKQVIGNANFENTEAGSLVQAGYYGSWWFANTIASFGGTKSEANLGNNLQVSRWHIGFADALFALGLKTNSDRYSIFSANGELFFGVSSNRLVESNVNDVLFAPGNPSTGIQGNVDWTFAAFNYCKFELSAFSRFTHFFKKTIESGNQKISYTPGSFVDVLLGFTQYYGSDYQHQFEIGYNPTVRVIKAEALNEQGASAANLNEPNAGKLYHTAYATYSYNWETKDLPMMFSLGGSATVTPHANTYGTVFGTFGFSF